VIVAQISVSVDGYAAGPSPSLEDPLGIGGEQLHKWAFRLEAWRKPHGLEGGEVDIDTRLVEEAENGLGAVVMGRKMFSGGAGPWADDPNGRGWWGDEPPFHAPVFVVTHHARDPLELTGTTFHFVTDGVEAAVARARDVAGEANISIAGGASIVQQCLAAGLLDELTVHTAPVVLGGGTRLFADGAPPQRLEVLEVVAVPLATHVRYRVGSG
jgi:dihydrofolate reductase